MGRRRTRPGARVGAGQRRRHGRPGSPTAATTARCAGSSRARPAYAELVDEEISYQGKDGRKRWNELGDTIAESWERAISAGRRRGCPGRATSPTPSSTRTRRCGSASAPSRSRIVLPDAHVPDRARRGARATPRATTPRSPSSAATTPSRCSPRSPTSRATAASPKEHRAASSSSGGASWPTSRTTTCSRRPTTRATTCASRPRAGAELRPRAGRVLRPRRRHSTVLDGADRRPGRLARARRRGRGPACSRRTDSAQARSRRRRCVRTSGAAVRTASAASSSKRDCDSRSASTRAM